MPRKKATETSAAVPAAEMAAAVKKPRAKAIAKAEVTATESAPLKKSAPRKKAAPAAEAVVESVVHLAEAVTFSAEIDPQDIQELAYQSWISRGCPVGSPDEDWFRAESQLRSLTAK